MLNKEALMMFKSGGIGKEELKNKILKKFPECNFAFIPYNPLGAGDELVTLVDNDDNIIINNPAINLRFSTSDPSLFSGRMLSVKTYNGPGLGDWEPDGYELHFNYVVDGGEPVFPSSPSGWRANFTGWGVDAGSLFVPSSTAISLDSTDEISQDSLDYTKYNVLIYSDAMFLWPNLSNYLYRGCVCMKITLVADTTAYPPEISEPEVPL
jgi:hypothetical protein